ncbi:PIR protein [Plasmodium ovale]|uniref:PIR Superfamily Protein n=2 Tax=Plasmodium ovale TaxID=36330 RepID=A0A1A8WDE9_PLAOA|nr:PIR Superfamily Protein [Plasmodium ovale curtisi]SBT84596.1 PIR protein [Plasmodium ovale]
MVDTTVFGDLPSSKFDKKFQEDIEYKTLETFEKTKTEQRELNTWIDKFKEKLIKYFNEEYKSWPKDIYQKRCRDLDYWVRKVREKIFELLKTDPQLAECVLRFQEGIPPIFEKNVYFKCNRYEDSLTELEVRKKLDDYCENRDYIKEKIDEKKNKDFCLIYNTYNRENDELFNKDSACKQEYYEPEHCIIHDKCTIKNKFETFPQIDCDQYDVSYDSENKSLLKKVLLSTPIILGICAFFLFLYKHTPLFSLILNGNFKRKINGILTEDKQEISERITEYSPKYTENDKNSIGYNMTSDDVY